MSQVDKVWVREYPDYVPSEIVSQSGLTLARLIESSLEKYASLVAFECMGAQLTYAELDRGSRSFAHYLLRDCQLQPGDRVALMMPNILSYPVALFGCLRAGMVVVNVNPLYTAHELQHQLSDSGARVLVVVENFAHVYAHIQQTVPLERVVVTSLGDWHPLPKKWLINTVVRHVKRLVPAYHLAKTETMAQAVRRGAAAQTQLPQVSGQDLAFLQYTGGTTGVSKGAMLTHANISSNVEQAYRWIQKIVSPGRDVVITALPLYHIFGLTANCLTFTRLGAKNVLIPNPRDMPGFVAELRKHRFTIFTGVNTLFNGLLNQPGFRKLDFSSLRCTLGGGMAVQTEVARRWKNVTGLMIHQAYGLTETSPAACINPLHLEEFNGSIGLPISSTEVQIVDDAGAVLPPGEPGELCIRGPQVMQGYWNRPDETAAVLSPDGWLRTGDIATMTASGYVFIVDRKKDMVLVSGFNVFPNEVEDILVQHPGVTEAAVVGVPDPKTGERVKAFVVSSDPQLSAETLIAFCRERLTSYKVPKDIEFRDELPKTNVGKVLRRALRDAAS